MTESQDTAGDDRDEDRDGHDQSGSRRPRRIRGLHERNLVSFGVVVA
jgi:hypothetical protein